MLYEWHFLETSLWSCLFQCSKTCGIGEQHRTVQCKQITKEGWILPDQSEAAACDAASRPTQRQACNYGDCSAEYHWKTDSWGEVRIVPVAIAIVILIQCTDLSGMCYQSSSDSDSDPSLCLRFRTETPWIQLWAVYTPNSMPKLKLDSFFLKVVSPQIPYGKIF